MTSHQPPLAPIAAGQAKARGLSTSVWGRAWCSNLERYSHYVGRLPQGRTLLRRGLVLDLQESCGCIQALVADSATAEAHAVTVRVTPCDSELWEALKQRCAGAVPSLLSLLQGQLSPEVMAFMTEPEHGLFPDPTAIRCACDCIDEADLCRHAAAALYGIGLRLDATPALLFALRQVDPAELTSAAASGLEAPPSSLGAEADLAGIFGFDLEP